MQYLTVSTPDADGNTLTPPPASPGGNSETRHRRVSIASTPPTVATEAELKSRKCSSVSGPEERRKSILHNPLDSVSVHSNFSHGSPNVTTPNHHDVENGKPPPLYNDGVPMKKFSMTEVLNSKPRYSFSELEKSWWFLLCKRCHQPETEPSWQPPGWNRMCPRHFCPSYRQFARMLALGLIILLCWGTVYAIMGRDAEPGGQLFNLAVLTLAAHCGGWVARIANLPSLVGMLLVGILLQNVGFMDIKDSYLEVVADLRRIALVIILTRAGLEMDPPSLRRLMVTVLKLGLVPWAVECIVIAVTSHFLLGLPWVWGFLLGSIVAAVSPAVVVPCLFRLRTKGYGVAKGIPTLIIAVSGIDDATSVAIFGIIKSIMFSADSLAYQIIQGPLSIIGGIGFGIVWGLLSKFVPEKDDPYVVPLRIMMLLGGGLIAVFGSDVIGFGGAGPLGCVTAAFVSCVCWTQQGWNIEDNPVATAFEIFWMIFEPILFGITGTQIKIKDLGGHDVYLTLACLVIGIVLRIFSTTLVAIGCRLNLKEKFFVSFSWMAKATVQAALGPVALDAVRQRSQKSDTDSDYANKVLMMCVLSILVTAPLGAIIITLTGPRLLTKTSTIPPDGWRRSARPSLRDISIIDEEENCNEENTAQS